MISHRSGFTLIEVLISIAILSVISLMVGQSVQQAVKTKDKIQTQVQDISQLRDAMRIIEADVNLAFHYRDIEKEITTYLNKNSNSSNQTIDPMTGQMITTPIQNTNDENQTNPDQAKRINPVTQFIGLAEQLDFTTLNSGKILSTQVQADFIEVGYVIKECRSINNKKTNGKCLFRRTSPYADEDVQKGGKEILLLENVTEFKLKYIGNGKQDWVDTWRTDNAGDGVTKNNFPVAVEVSLATEITNKTSKKYSMYGVFPIHFPNNAEKNAGAQASGN